MINVNDILYNKEEEKDYRILWISREQGVAYVFALACERMPVGVPLKDIERYLLDGTMERRHSDEYFKAVFESAKLF